MNSDVEVLQTFALGLFSMWSFNVINIDNNLQNFVCRSLLKSVKNRIDYTTDIWQKPRRK